MTANRHPALSAIVGFPPKYLCFTLRKPHPLPPKPSYNTRFPFAIVGWCRHDLLCMANLTKGLPILLCPCEVWLVPSHGNLCVPRSIHGPLIDIGWPTNDILIIHYHPFSMHIYHEPPVLLRQSLQSQATICYDIFQTLVLVPEKINSHYPFVILPRSYTKICTKDTQD
jgi:hypothetical protein